MNNAKRIIVAAVPAEFLIDKTPLHINKGFVLTSTNVSIV